MRRHGATSALLADGATPAVVRKQLRHSDPRITLGIYGHVIGNQQRDAVENRSARIEQFAVNLTLRRGRNNLSAEMECGKSKKLHGY